MYTYHRQASRLYVVSNSAATPPAGVEWVAVPAANHTLMTVRGSRAKPVANLTLHGLGLRDTAWTMMQPHGVPSGGDWALERMGALLAPAPALPPSLTRSRSRC